MEKVKTRNQLVDNMRGIAILMVVLGHTMTGCTINSEKSFVFNVIWSLQMPLFILISGYVTRYSHSISNFKDLYLYLKKRTISYILPWVIWSVGIRGILFGETNFLNVCYMFWHMDSGYWFLFSIWTINVIFGISMFLGKKIIKKIGLKQQCAIAFIYILGMCILLGAGIIFELSFLSIKLTLYYMPFYFVGYLYGQFSENINNTKQGKVMKEIVVVISFFVWLFVILRYSLYSMSDSGLEVIFRAIISLLGCIAVCGLFDNVIAKNKSVFTWFGTHSQEVYLVHHLVLNMIKTVVLNDFQTIQGLLLVSINYIVTVILVYLIINVINKNIILRKLIFAK